MLDFTFAFHAYARDRVCDNWVRCVAERVYAGVGIGGAGVGVSGAGPYMDKSSGSILDCTSMVVMDLIYPSANPCGVILCIAANVVDLHLPATAWDSKNPKRQGFA